MTKILRLDYFYFKFGVKFANFTHETCTAKMLNLA